MISTALAVLVRDVEFASGKRSRFHGEERVDGFAIRMRRFVDAAQPRMRRDAGITGLRVSVDKSRSSRFIKPMVKKIGANAMPLSRCQKVAPFHQQISNVGSSGAFSQERL